MKSQASCFALALFIAATVLGRAVSYQVTVPPGYSAIANQLNNGGNTLDQVLPGVPDGCMVYKWDCAAYTPYTYIAGIGWTPSGGKLKPGEGAWFQNPTGAALTLTFSGTEPVPIFPWLQCGCHGYSFVSRQTPGVGSFQNITGMIPTDGTVWLEYDAANQDFVTNVYTGAVWQGGTPTADVGEAVWIALNCDATNKWYQPPVPAFPTNVYYGWNEPSMEEAPAFAADDWVCTTTKPVTKIRWWGSFLNWTQPYPPQVPQSFHIRFWTDVPKGADPQWPNFSHPGQQIGPNIFCQNFRWQFVGWDYDPRSRRYESCFLFEQNLLPHEYFYQEPGPTGTNIYWLSIQALIANPTNVWGWKTRPRDPTSPAPDDAVWFDPVAHIYQPLFWPEETNSWDLAFELLSQTPSGGEKWLQVPDLTTNGIDVNATWNPQNPQQPPLLLADDFLCTSPGPITNITVWGSWWHDLLPENNPGMASFTLSIHKDIPAQQSPTGYSMPGETIWWTNLYPGQFTWTEVPLRGDFEGWWTPPEPIYEVVGDKRCFRYDFPILTNYFIQEGTPANPVVYWLDIQAQPLAPPTGELPTFGWKTCPTNWNDDACWIHGMEPVPAALIWNELRYPMPHPRMEQSMDLAFRIQGIGETGEEYVKWSQPPEPYEPDDGFNGWNERSTSEGQQIVADDWVCTNATPVTDIHWWGSFINWTEPVPPRLPDGFQIAFWTDVPAQGTVFSHPGVCLKTVICTNYTWKFVGWDWDPRNPGAGPEACFKFEQDFLPDEYFKQEPGTNIYWVSIAAIYATGQEPAYPWGWKTRPRDPRSPAPDDAVRIFSPTYPTPGIQYQSGQAIWWPDPTVSWDMAFVLTTKEEVQPTEDFGDAPNPYPTLLPNGARHTVVPGVFMGNIIDAELNGIPSLLALGDDLNNLPDEDGVAFGLFVPGETGVAQVTVSTPGFVSVWVDLNGDGSWATPGDQVVTDAAVGAGTTALTFPVPTTAVPGINTFVRVRFSRVTGLSFTGLAPDGEVEDYRVRIEELDFGDAPDPVFPTLRINNGARHMINPNLFLGALIDAESDGQPNAIATGDDIANLADEDGVVMLTPLIPGQPATAQVTVSSANGILNAWIDFGADGSWATPGDQIAVNVVFAAPGANLLNFVVPPGAAAGSNVFARFRYSTLAGLSYTNFAPDGEIEDYQFAIAELDFGDAPDPAYPTLRAQSGAAHAIGRLFMGARVDGEPDGQPGPNALGDDNNPVGLDDEDGVTFLTALIAGVPAQVQVVCSGPGLLQAWVDWNQNGSWAEANEQIIANYPVIPGLNTIPFFVPNNLPSGKTFARFRLSTVANLGFTGVSPDGEVEDYEVTLYPLKWLQPPEQGSEGVDVNNAVLLADDFLCDQSGPITDIHIWGSFFRDQVPQGGPGSMVMTLSLFKDVPVGPDNLFSHPGELLWSRTFSPGEYQAANNFTSTEWWHNPAVIPPTWVFPGDTNMYQFDFYIDPTNAFKQTEGTIYWLAVSNSLVGANSLFGWKTTYKDWNDDACWWDPVGLGWRPLVYGDGHPRNGQSMNLAFAISGPTELSELDFGDAPTPFPTMLPNGARHFAVPGFRLGRLEDTEPNGMPNLLADGDDMSNLADEDGVRFLGPVLIGTNSCVEVSLMSGPSGGKLDAWVDLNGNKSWADPGEQVFTNLALAPGLSTNCFAVPCTTKLGTNYARFRLSSVGGLPPGGLAMDGEVEDLRLLILQPRPTNIVITHISVTNLVTGGTTNQVASIYWNAQNCIHYQLLSATNLGTTNGSGIAWSPEGPEVIGPAKSQAATNAWGSTNMMFFRVVAPFTWP